MTELEVATTEIERSGIPWPVIAVTVAAFMVALDLSIVVGTPASVDQALHRFRIAWLVGAAAGLGSAAVSSFHRRPADTTVAVPIVLAGADAA